MPSGPQPVTGSILSPFPRLPATLFKRRLGPSAPFPHTMDKCWWHAAWGLCVLQLSLAQQQIGEWLLAWATRMRSQSVPGLQQDVPGLNSPGREYSKVSSAKQSSVCGYAVGQFVIGKRRFGERKKRKGEESWLGRLPAAEFGRGRWRLSEHMAQK